MQQKRVRPDSAVVFDIRYARAPPENSFRVGKAAGVPQEKMNIKKN